MWLLCGGGEGGGGGINRVNRSEEKIEIVATLL